MAEQDIKEEGICSCRSQHFPQLCNPWRVVACLLVCLWDLLGTELERNAAPINKRTKALSVWLSCPELRLCVYHRALASFTGEALLAHNVSTTFSTFSNVFIITALLGCHTVTESPGPFTRVSMEMTQILDR